MHALDMCKGCEHDPHCPFLICTTMALNNHDFKPNPLVLHIGRSTILAIMQGCHVPRGFQLQEWNHESKTETLLIMVQTDPTLKSTLDLNDPKLDEVGTTPLRNRPAMTKKMGRFLILLGLWSCVATMVQFEDTKRVFDISRGLFSRWLIWEPPNNHQLPTKAATYWATSFQTLSSGSPVDLGEMSGSELLLIWLTFMFACKAWNAKWYFIVLAAIVIFL